MSFIVDLKEILTGFTGIQLLDMDVTLNKFVLKVKFLSGFGMNIERLYTNKILIS